MMAPLVGLMAMLAAGVEAVALSDGDADGICFVQFDFEDVAWNAPSPPKAWLPTRRSVLEGFPPLRAKARKVIEVIGEVTRQLIKNWEPKWARKATAAAQRVGPSKTSEKEKKLTFGDGDTKFVIFTTHNSFRVEGAGKIVSYARRDKPPAIAKGKEHKFNNNEIGKEFVISVPAPVGKTISSIDAAFVVMREAPDLCGVAPYSSPLQKERKNPYIDDDEKEKRQESYLDNYCSEDITFNGKYLKENFGIVDRGFGVEFEFVARPPSDEFMRKEPGMEEKGVGKLRNMFYDVETDYAKGLWKQCFERMAVSDNTNDKWTFMKDSTVMPFTDSQAGALGLENEKYGWSFEVVSPGPTQKSKATQEKGHGVLWGQWGLESVAGVLYTLRKMGVQAPPSAGLHIHVNVGDVAPPWKSLTYENVANIWAAYARYQLVIDEFLPPMRITNKHAEPLFLGNRPTNHEKLSKLSPPEIFKNIVTYVVTYGGKQKEKKGNIADFCHHALGGTKSYEPCTKEEYPSERYFTLNLAALVRLGTIEFRGHGATYDTEQVLHWIIFHVAFVDSFQDKPFWTKKNPDEALKELASLQKKATRKQLITEMGKYKETIMYLSDRHWEKKTLGCKTP